jgi:DNA-binding NarL/FixJ family response regulator
LAVFKHVLNVYSNSGNKLKLLKTFAMKFLLADDHSIVRMGLRLMIEKAYPGAGIDEADKGNTILEKIKTNRYDLIILDFQMPNTDTFGVIDHLITRDDKVKILIYSMASEKMYAVKLFKAGVKGFLSKEMESSEILKAIHLILNGRKYVSEEVISELTEDKNNTNSDNPFSGLTNKEMDILNYLIHGKNTKEISTLASLHISTISTHKFRIFRKLNITNMVELITLAKEHKLY